MANPITLGQKYTAIRFQPQTVRRVTENLRKLAGKAKAIIGILSENMHYAVYVEYGTSRTYPRPHMRPAFGAMLRRFLPTLAAILQRVGVPDYDALCVDAMRAALYELEAWRMAYLALRVYTPGRLAEEAAGTNPYKLTFNLRFNRTLEVQAIGRPDLNWEARGRAPVAAAQAARAVRRG